MAKKPAAQIKTVHDPLTDALRQAFDPLVFALDCELSDEGIGRKRLEMLDAGQTLPSAKDNSTRWLLDQFCKTLWRQNYGMGTVTRKRADGTEYQTNFDNNEQRLLKSRTTKEMIDAKDIETWSEPDLQAQYWYHVNEARFDAINELLNAFATVYRDIFNENWKPNEVAAENKKPVVPADITKERAKLMAARFAKLEARK